MIKTNDVIGDWTILVPVYDTIKSNPRSLCKCSCGKTRPVLQYSLLSGRSLSCGHNNRFNNSTHRKTHSRLHEIWLNIRKRCRSKNNTNYKNYGGRGISVCLEWDDFVAFEMWATKSGYEHGLTIERIDVNGNYCPENCTWIPNNCQAKNTRRNIRLFYNGEEKILSEWAKELNVPYSTMKYRLKHDYCVEEILYGRSR